MEIFYSTGKIEKVLTNYHAMVKKYGPEDAMHLVGILQQIKYANSLKDIPEAPRPRRHKLHGNFKEYWGIHFSRKNVIVVNPYGDFIIDDLSSIKCLEVIMVGDYH
jgi:proteic killer suppression protein